jgi:hypothetical protein
MAGGRALAGAAAGAGSGAGVPGLLGLLVVMEAGVPIPVPSDLVMLLLGERVSAGALPLWLAMVLLELVALAGTAPPCSWPREGPAGRSSPASARAGPSWPRSSRGSGRRVPAPAFPRW